VLRGLGRFDEAIEVASRGIARARRLGRKGFWEHLSANIAREPWSLADGSSSARPCRAGPRDVAGSLAGSSQPLRACLAAERGERAGEDEFTAQKAKLLA
jgi:hypothetical protein